MSRLKKTLIAVILTAVFGFGSLTAFGWTPSDYTITAGTANWQTKYNNFINAIYGQIMQLSALINNWASEDNIITMVQATPTYSSATAFTLPGDYTSRFTAGRVVQVQVAAGMVYSSVASSTYSAPNTTVNLHDSLLTNPISRVYVVATRNGLWPNGPGYVVARDYGSDRAALVAADAVAAAAGKQLLIGNPYTIDQDVTLSSAVKMMPGAVLTRSGGTHLTIKGKFEGCDGCFADNTATHNWVVFGVRAASEALPQWWGGVADGVTISTAAVQAALNAFNGLTAGAWGGTVRINGIFALNGNLICPRNVSLLGNNPVTCGFKSTSGLEHKVSIQNVTGVEGMWRQKINSLDFRLISLYFGEADADGALGTILSDCSVHGCDVGVKFIYGCWEFMVHGCHFYQNHIGLYLDWATSQTGIHHSGSPVTISDCSCYNNYNAGAGAGIYVNGCCIDGADIKISNTDMQHSDYGLYVANSNTWVGNIYLTNPHFELNRYANIYNQKYNIYVDGIWGGSNSGSWIAQVISADALSYTAINSGWISYAWGKLVKLTAGSLFMDYNKLKSPTFTGGTPCTADKVGGNLLVPRPYVYYRNWGLSQAITSSQWLLDNIWEGDVSPHHYKLHLTSTAGTGVGNLYVRQLANSINYDNIIPLPNETGTIDIDLWVTAAYITATLRFDGTTTHQTYYHQVPNGRTVASRGRIYLLTTGHTTLALNNFVMSVE